jgi:general L-amino acid transport system substrate-binding protein
MTDGNWTGLDVDLCRAVAAAVFGDATAGKFTPLSAKERFTALQSGEVDVLSRNTTWTMSRDTQLGLNFAGVNYYDGQGFMVRNRRWHDSALELSGASVCTNTGTTTELNVADYFRANNMAVRTGRLRKADEVVAAYDAGRCDVLHHRPVRPVCTAPEADQPGRAQGSAGNHLQGAAWSGCSSGRRSVVQHRQVGPHRDVNAEELGVTAGQCRRDEANGDNPSVKRLLGTEGEFGEAIGLATTGLTTPSRPSATTVKSSMRNVGPDTPLGIAAASTRCGRRAACMYGPPIR